MKRPNKNDYLTTNQFTYHEELNKYYEALEKYADFHSAPVSPSDAIEFAEWIEGNYLIRSSGGFWFKHSDGNPASGITTTDLYDLFTEERKQK